MSINKMRGKQSIYFNQPVSILSHACMGGQKEGQGPLGARMDVIVQDPMFGCSSWEECESKLLHKTCELAVKKGKVTMDDIRIIFSGDLLRQLTASSFGIKTLGLPFYGVYGACSSIGVALSLGAMAVDGGYADKVLSACSSHFASAEKEFRFPLGYGNQRPYSATWTATGAGAFLLSNQSFEEQSAEAENVPPNESKDGSQKEEGLQMDTRDRSKKEEGLQKDRGRYRVGIRGITTGKIKDYGVKNPFNMGACMAPAAADTIYQALEDFSWSLYDFDQIITGDLGTIGRELLLSLLKENGISIGGIHMDCGMQLYNDEKQDTHAGGSGPACCALVLSSMILPRLEQGIWKRVLFVPTGALLSQVTNNEGRSIPSIAHGIVLEAKEMR